MRKFNLSLDDMSPHPKAGLNFESINWCNELINKYPGIKINLFVPAAYCRLGENPVFLSQHMDWVDRVNNLPDNYKINMHGLYHRRTGYLRQHDSNNDEFQFLDVIRAKNIISDMIEEFEKAGLNYIKTFRPPGWKISVSAADVLARNGFIIAGNNQYHGIISKKLKNISWVSYNWDLTGPCKVSKDIIAYGHTSSWTNNYMNKDRFKLIDNILSKEEFNYVFIEKLVRYGDKYDK